MRLQSSTRHVGALGTRRAEWCAGLRVAGFRWMDHGEDRTLHTHDSVFCSLAVRMSVPRRVLFATMAPQSGLDSFLHKSSRRSPSLALAFGPGPSASHLHTPVSTANSTSREQSPVAICQVPSPSHQFFVFRRAGHKILYDTTTNRQSRDSARAAQSRIRIVRYLGRARLGRRTRRGRAAPHAAARHGNRMAAHIYMWALSTAGCARQRDTAPPRRRPARWRAANRCLLNQRAMASLLY